MTLQKEIIDDLLEECPCKDKWCFPRELFFCLKLPERQLKQMRLFCDERFMDSIKAGKEIGKDEAAFEFIKNHAARFAEVDREGKKKDELFKEIFGFEKVHTDEYTAFVHQESLNDLLEECPCKDKWCFPKELLSYQTKKRAEKFRLAYDYKFMQSEKEGKDIGTERMEKEFDMLYGENFDKLYQEGMKHEYLFEQVFGIKKKLSPEEIRNMFRD